MEVGLEQSVERGRCSRRGILNRSAFVTQDGRVETVQERRVPGAGLSANPVVSDRLICIQL